RTRSSLFPYSTLFRSGGALIDTFDILYAGPIGPLQTDTVFITNINTLGGGTYNFTVFTEHPDEFDPTNDTLFTTVTVLPIPSQVTFAVDYDSICFSGIANFAVSNPATDVFYSWHDEEFG